MKKSLLFCTFMLSAFSVIAQQNYMECATPDPTTPDPLGVYSHSNSIDDLDNCEPIVFNVKFWE